MGSVNFQEFSRNLNELSDEDLVRAREIFDGADRNQNVNVDIANVTDKVKELLLGLLVKVPRTLVAKTAEELVGRNSSVVNGTMVDDINNTYEEWKTVVQLIDEELLYRLDYGVGQPSRDGLPYLNYNGIIGDDIDLRYHPFVENRLATLTLGGRHYTL